MFRAHWRRSATTQREGTGHLLIDPDREHATLAALAGTGIARRMIRFRSDSEGAQFNAMRAGMGIGTMQAGVARRNPALRQVLAERIAFWIECWLTMHEDLHASARIRLGADHLALAQPAALARSGADYWFVCWSRDARDKHHGAQGAQTLSAWSAAVIQS